MMVHHAQMAQRLKVTLFRGLVQELGCARVVPTDTNALEVQQRKVTLRLRESRSCSHGKQLSRASWIARHRHASSQAHLRK